jgi:thiol-disulfide isomerase/thioredoxin
MTATKTARFAWLAPLALALGLAVLTAGTPRAADFASAREVKLESLKFDAFMARIAASSAADVKYTLVDVWSTTCGPCKENFPHLVQMHHKYGSKGLQTISLSLDDTTDAKAVAAARAFLVEKKATFLNVLLDEKDGVGFDKLDINTIPAVFLYGPDGKLIKKFTMDDPNNQFTYEDVEKEVASRLAVKPASSK